MPAADAVGAVAVSRAEVRKSLDRLERQLARGTKGARGVRQEVKFLDAIHRQTVRLSGIATGQPYVTNPQFSFGTKAAKGLNSGNTRTIGKVKSSILADFSSDGLQPARDWANSPAFAAIGGEWVWQANASACPTCLAAHGRKFQGPFIPKHPSCLCIPIPVVEAGRNGVTELSADVIGDQVLTYGDPRYYKMARDLKNGTQTLSDAAAVENVNGQARGFQAWRQHMEKKEVYRADGAPPRIPTTEPIPGGPAGAAPIAPPEAPAPTTPPATSGKTPHPDIDLDDFDTNLLRTLLEDGLDPTYDLTDITKKIQAEILRRGEPLVKAAGKITDLTDDTLKLLQNRATKKAQKQFADAIELVEKKIAKLAPAQQQQYYDALAYVRTLRLETLKKIPADGRMTLGHWGEVARVPRRGIVRQELMIQTKRVDWDEYQAYIKKNNAWVKENNAIYRKAQAEGRNPWDAAQAHQARIPQPLQPKGLLRDATADEMSSTLIHELTHVIDSLKNEVPRRQALQMWELAKKEFDAGADRFWYAASIKDGRKMVAETVADLSRFYVEGWPTKQMTALEWRAKYPEMARFVEEVVYA